MYLNCSFFNRSNLGRFLSKTKKKGKKKKQLSVNKQFIHQTTLISFLFFFSSFFFIWIDCPVVRSIYCMTGKDEADKGPVAGIAGTPGTIGVPLLGGAIGNPLASVAGGAGSG